MKKKSYMIDLLYIPKDKLIRKMNREEQAMNARKFRKTRVLAK